MQRLASREVDGNLQPREEHRPRDEWRQDQRDEPADASGVLPQEPQVAREAPTQKVPKRVPKYFDGHDFAGKHVQGVQIVEGQEFAKEGTVKDAT